MYRYNPSTKRVERFYKEDSDPENGTLEEIEGLGAFYFDEDLDDFLDDREEVPYKYRPNPNTTYTPKKCECGKEKHNFACHLDFCPLYDPDKDGSGNL